MGLVVEEGRRGNGFVIGISGRIFTDRLDVRMRKIEKQGKFLSLFF